MLRLVPLSRLNWEQCLDIRLSEAQQAYTPSVLYSLAQSKFDNLNPMGIYEGIELIGFLMYGNFNGVFWLNRLMIDLAYQGHGLGREAVHKWLEMSRKHPQCKEIRTSYHAQNQAAQKLFTSLGFVEMSHDALEIVAKWEEEENY